MEKNNKLKLTWRQWLICYAGSVGFGGLTWWATGNPWIGGGVLVAFTAAYVFYLAGQVAKQPKQVAAEGMSRQQKRAIKRKNKS